MQINLVITPPHKAMLIRSGEPFIYIFGNIEIIRASPYPPSFRRIAASTIDPAIGASTWALGSHRCTVNIGSFTKNPPRVKIQKNENADIHSGNNSSDLIDMRLLFEEA